MVRLFIRKSIISVTLFWLYCQYVSAYQTLSKYCKRFKNASDFHNFFTDGHASSRLFINNQAFDNFILVLSVYICMPEHQNNLSSLKVIVIFTN